MRNLTAGVAACLAMLCAPGHAGIDEKAIGEAIAMRERGEFDKATNAFRSYIEQSSATLDQSERRMVEFEIERIRRIRMDYKLTREKLLEDFKKKVPDFKPEELDQFERDGMLDALLIDGQKFYVGSSVSNLLFRVPELQARRPNFKPDGTLRKLYGAMLRVKEAQKLSPDALLLPQDFQVTFTLTVNANAAPAGKVLRCWLPFVRAFPFQTDAYILGTEPANCTVAPPEAAHRTLYLEKAAEKDKPTVFQARYIYRAWARATNIDPSKVTPYPKDSPLAYYAAERKPHLDLGNELLKKLNAEIVGGETNPYLIARRIHEWMGKNLVYQYAREYSTLDNISFYTASRRAGDCGQHGMLFIALCRLNGIPARWQSGWESFEAKGNNMHDWTEFYVEPYGWLPADTDMAINVLRHNNGDLDTTQAQELADWLLGNMDHFRLATNSDYGAPLFPSKNDFRSETVDFQRGEVEFDDSNLYFDQWDYKMEIAPIPQEEAADYARRFVPAPVVIPPSESKPVDEPTTQTATKDEATSATTEKVAETSPVLTVNPEPKTSPDNASTSTTESGKLAQADESTSSTADGATTATK
ncbi:MAG: transglutaminase domain-containing protein [Candidatus Sumerlaeaceae bacterium]|nr:transglutaminase domain-containing protein [Candidatus Sumerlaeaceae bacterium]